MASMAPAQQKQQAPQQAKFAPPPKAPVAVKKSLPDYSSVLSNQNSEGFWPEVKLSTLTQFLNKALPDSLDSLPSDKVLLCTLLAVFVLENFFEEREDEWRLIAKKARTYLLKNNVSLTRAFDELSDYI
jgi:hypothetical protein